jgi:hypothetical protein
MFVVNIFVFLLQVYLTVSKIVKITYNLLCIDTPGLCGYMCFLDFIDFKISVRDDSKHNIWGLV